MNGIDDMQEPLGPSNCDFPPTIAVHLSLESGPYTMEEIGPTGCFQAWVEEEFDPTLRAVGMVILDNPTSHKGKAVRWTIRSIGARLWFAPPCCRCRPC